MIHMARLPLYSRQRTSLLPLNSKSWVLVVTETLPAAVVKGLLMPLPVVVMRPIWLAKSPGNHGPPSGPGETPPILAVGIGNSVTTPAVVMRPILLAPFSINHSAPSGPA